MRIEPRSLIAIDFDGVIALGDMWCFYNLKPNKPMVDLIRAWVREKHHIIIYTARREWDRQQIEHFLLKHKIPYHALVCGKLAFDYLIDDKCINISDIFNVKKT